MEPKLRATHGQFTVMLDFMESHGDIGKSQPGLQRRIRSDRLWLELTDLLNNIGGGVKKPMEKWKKVWADWKTKTKKKAKLLSHRASVNGGAPSRQTLTSMELKLLGLMGFSVVIGEVDVKDLSCDDAPPDPKPIDAEHAASDEIIIDFLPERSQQAPSPTTVPSGQLPPSSEQSTSIPLVRSPAASTSRAPPRRLMRWNARSAMSNSCCLHRRRLQRQHRTQTPHEGATGEFTAIELRRLRLEEERDRRHHERELERLRLESRRIEVEENHNLIFNRLADILDRFLSN